ncbi:hypothetical protein HanXRQr2_Chr07g0313831 [Helianthus annuus]|nr:hypothetical protein HanXRQr2_Chr07g0313831 [Helianthus annuus]KAJ0906259.1 hypothetical protein HanPSC8_Chr07g0303511 [Helianthus annuus]
MSNLQKLIRNWRHHSYGICKQAPNKMLEVNTRKKRGRERRLTSEYIICVPMVGIEISTKLIMAKNVKPMIFKTLYFVSTKSRMVAILVFYLGL